MKIHHIGYLVKKIEKAIESFETLGYSLTTASTWDEGRKAYICFLENDGYCVELICPSKESSLYPLLKQYNNAPYHICYICRNIEETIQDLKEQKFMMFKEPAPAPVIGDHSRVAFLINARVGMIELVEGV